MGRTLDNKPAPKDGRDLELDTQQRLTALAWSAQISGGSGDRGADVVAFLGTTRAAATEVLVVQCKDWGVPVGYEAVKEVFAAKHLPKATRAAVVSRNGFSRQAIGTAHELDVALLHPADIVQGCVFDRTTEGAAIREVKAAEEAAEKAEQVRRSAEEARRRLTADWTAYDEASLAYPELAKKHSKAKKRLVPITLGAGAVGLFGPLASGAELPDPAMFVIILVLAGGTFFFVNPGLEPQRPVKPDAPRP